MAVGDEEKEREARGGLGRKSSKLLLRMVADLRGAWRSWVAERQAGDGGLS